MVREHCKVVTTCSECGCANDPIGSVHCHLSSNKDDMECVHLCTPCEKELDSWSAAFRAGLSGESLLSQAGYFEGDERDMGGPA